MKSVFLPLSHTFAALIFSVMIIIFLLPLSEGFILSSATLGVADFIKLINMQPMRACSGDSILAREEGEEDDDVERKFNLDLVAARENPTVGHILIKPTVSEASINTRKGDFDKQD